MRSFAAASLLALTLVATPAAAAPPDAGGDLVSLKDGGMLRGTLIEVMPGDHASLQLATGQVAVIRWDAIAKIDRGGARTAAPAPAPAPASGGAPPTAAAAPAGPTATVHIDTDRAVRLERRQGREWVFVCNAPCDAPAPLAAEYRMTGDMRATRGFHLGASPGGHVTLSPSPASGGAFVGGIVLASVGLGASLVGLSMILVGNNELLGGNEGLKNAGTATAVSGLAGIAVGVVLVVTNVRSGVDQASSAAGTPDVRGGRAPAWADARRDESQRASTLPTFPLLSGAF